MKNVTQSILRSVFFLALLAVTSVALADDPGDPGDVLGGGGSGSQAVGVPVDGGASLLLVGGVVAAARGLRNRRRTEKETKA